MTKRLSLLLGALLGAGGCYRVVIEWPKQPLQVQISGNGACVNPPGGNTASADASAATDGGISDPPPPPLAQPVTKRVSTTPLALSSKSGSTVVFVEYTNASSGSSINVFEADGTAGDACSSGNNKKQLWRLSNGGRWDAQVKVDNGKSVCVEPGNYTDGDVTYMVR
jgi:hypothetical protein